MQLILTKRAKDGRQIEVFAGARIAGEFEIVRVTLGGQPVKGISGNVYSLPEPQGGATHYIDGKPPIGLTAVEAETVIGALNAMRTAWEQTEAGQRTAQVSLREQRRLLVAEHRGLIDEQAHQFERAHDRQDATAWTIKEGFEPQIAAAARAIRDFDAAHPEVLAAIKAEEAESVERNRWM